MCPYGTPGGGTGEDDCDGEDIVDDGASEDVEDDDAGEDVEGDGATMRGYGFFMDVMCTQHQVTKA